MKRATSFGLAVLTILATAVATQVLAIDQADYSVSSQGLITDGSPAGTFISPGGAYEMTITPVKGDFHYLEADLLVTSRDGQEWRLREVVGNAFLISDLGRIVAIEASHPVVQPSTLEILDLTRNELAKIQVNRLTDPILRTDGSALFYRSREGVIELDLEDFNQTVYPVFDLFAVGRDGLLAGVENQTNLTVCGYADEPVSIDLDQRPIRLAFSSDGESILLLNKGSLERIMVATSERSTLFNAPAGAELRDLRIADEATHLGLRRQTGGAYSGEMISIEADGNTLSRQPGPSKQIPSAEGLPKTLRGIPWPLAPNAQHEVGNTYAEYQNYGSSYLHPGVDAMGLDNQPMFAVEGGIVKAILTTSGEWHWRIAIGGLGSGTSTGYLYAHVEQYSITVNVGDPVTVGQYIGDLVPWPVYEFTHIHFARIEDTGAEWHGDWLCTDNPHLDFDNQSETEAPIFEPARGNDLFAFCVNETSTYQEPDALQGQVDIIAHVGDTILTDWVCTVQEIRYSIYPVGDPSFLIVDDKLSVYFDMELDTYQGGPIDPFLVDLLFKQDSTCRTYGDYDRREFYHIITNSDGDQDYEESDVWEAWDTTTLPDGDYVIEVTATDVVGNSTTESMVVTTANGNPQSIASGDGWFSSLSIRSYPNPINGKSIVRFASPVADRINLSVYDLSGRLVSTLLDVNLKRGIHSAHWDGTDSRGKEVPAGVYMFRLAGSDETETARFILLR